MSFLDQLFPAVLALTLGLFVAWRLFRSKDYDEDQVLDLVLGGLVAALFGARASFVVLHWSNYAGSSSYLLGILHLWDGGFNLEAGVLSFLLLAFYFLRRAKWPYFPSLDYLAMGGVVTALVFLIYEVVVEFYLPVLFKILILGLAVVVFRWYYRKGSVLALLLISLLKPLLVLTGGLVFAMVNGKNLWLGFKEGFMSKLNQKNLKQEEQRLQGQLTELNTLDPKNRPERMMENAPEEEGDEAETGSRVVAIRNVIAQKLKNVRQALTDLRRGNYGICDKCGQKIDPARLRAVPDAQYCLVCEKELEEQKEQQSAA